MPPSKPSNPSALTCSPGNLVKGTPGIEFEDNDWEQTIRELQLRMQHLESIAPLKSAELIKIAEQLLTQKEINDLEELAQKLEKFSQLNKRLRKYKKSDSAETWASRIASQIAYLFPSERREEWLGDLYEVNREMLHKGYPHWQINLNNLAKTVILIISALKIRLSDFISLGKVKS